LKSVGVDEPHAVLAELQALPSAGPILDDGLFLRLAGKASLEPSTASGSWRVRALDRFVDDRLAGRSSPLSTRGADADTPSMAPQPARRRWSLRRYRSVDSGIRIALEDVALDRGERRKEAGAGDAIRRAWGAWDPPTWDALRRWAGETGLFDAPEAGAWTFRHPLVLRSLASAALSRRRPERLARYIRIRDLWLFRRTWSPADALRWVEVLGLLIERDRAFEPSGGDVDRCPLWLSGQLAALGAPIESLVSSRGRPTRLDLGLIRTLVDAMPDRVALAEVLCWMGSAQRDDRAVQCLIEAALFAIDPEPRGSTEIGPVRLGVPDPPWIPLITSPDRFYMGCDDPRAPPDERPTVHVFLTEPIEMSAVPVTRALYAVVTGDLPWDSPAPWDWPVTHVSHGEAVAFCERLTIIQGRDGHCVRLPTEAEWEYACRFDSKATFSLDDDPQRLERYAWFESNSGDEAHPVGLKLHDGKGLYDMHGNVWEWCSDVYAMRERSEPPAEGVGLTYVNRGGSFKDGWRDLRSTARGNDAPGYADRTRGFRVVRARRTP